MNVYQPKPVSLDHDLFCSCASCSLHVHEDTIWTITWGEIKRLPVRERDSKMRFLLRVMERAEAANKDYFAFESTLTRRGLDRRLGIVLYHGICQYTIYEDGRIPVAFNTIKPYQRNNIRFLLRDWDMTSALSMYEIDSAIEPTDHPYPFWEIWKRKSVIPNIREEALDRFIGL